jgi:hypothetical protein
LGKRANSAQQQRRGSGPAEQTQERLQHKHDIRRFLRWKGSRRRAGQTKAAPFESDNLKARRTPQFWKVCGVRWRISGDARRPGFGIVSLSLWSSAATANNAAKYFSPAAERS